MHTCIKFLSEGYNVVGLDNLNKYYSPILKNDRLKNILKKSKSFNSNFTFLKNDLNSKVWNDLNQMNIDIVIHLAAQAGVRYSIENPNAYLESNIFGFQNKPILYFCFCFSFRDYFFIIFIKINFIC